MIVMPSNHSSFTSGYLAGKYPGRIGWLFNTSDWSRKPRPEVPWAIDNGAYGSYLHGTPWDERAFYDKALRFWPRPPMWIAVPDVVTDREATLKLWEKHAPRLKGRTLAFVVQDGMTARDVPDDASVVFVGGSTSWKWETLTGWCRDFPRVHVGRVNTERHLWMSHEAGAESCDGTGWFRAESKTLPGLLRYLEESTTGRKQTLMNLQ